MKRLIMISLLTINGTAIAAGTHSGHHEQAKTEAHGGGGHGESGHHGGHMQSAVGMPAMASQATKTIRVELLDTMRFKFSEEVDIKDGDIVTFVVTNNGRLTHEFSIGDIKEQDNHRAMMRKMPNMMHEDGNTVSLNAGETKELTWQFIGDKMGDKEVVFACNLPGHYEAGMHRKTMIQ